MKTLFTILIVIVLSISTQAQSTQIIRGKVVDHVSKMPLIGVVISAKDQDIAATTDTDGNFILENIPIGRQVITAQYLGYEPYESDGLIISTSKINYLEIGLVEQIQTTETVTVTASGGANKALNELSVVSSRSFSVEETNRYPASVGDPGRMAAAFPGVQSDGDNENDVAIRGNSAFGILWLLEGLEIPNPSHFARPGTTGGGISVLSASVLGNTDFSTGGFAAEYGNALSGVFDMRNRRGNMMEREHSIKIGFIGLGASTEGPIKKGRSSYLVNYRYSTLGLLNTIGVYVIAENATNTFQDLSFNLTFNSADNKNEVKVFGVGGLSNGQFTIKEDTSQWLNLYDYLDDNAGANLGILGVSFRRLLNEKSYLQIVAGTVYNHMYLRQRIPNLITKDINDLTVIRAFNNQTLRSQLRGTYSNKLSKRFRLKTGVALSANTYSLNHFINEYHFLDNVNGTTFIGQAYVQGSYHPTSNLTINAGAHALFLALNNTYSIEPRLGVQYKPTKSTTISAAYTWHSKILPIGTYLLQLPDGNGGIHQPNKDLELAKTQHVILGVRQSIGLGFNINVEGYYQYGFDQPTSVVSNSGFWLFNQRDNYGRVAMISEGQAQNYGVNAVIEKAFSRKFFVLLTGSLFAAQYKSLNDTDWRRARLDKQWGFNAMGGYEFTFKKGGVLQVGARAILSGGLRYTPADRAASIAAGSYIADEERIFAAASDNYFRLDARIAYRKNHKKLSYSISLDVQNATNAQNEGDYEYDPGSGMMVPRYQAGLLPILSFQLNL